MEYFGLKLGQDLGNRAAHPYQEFRGVPPPPPGARLAFNIIGNLERLSATVSPAWLQLWPKLHLRSVAPGRPQALKAVNCQSTDNYVP